ncbi:hypothetical protein, partial [Parasphingorhabdus sp.]|uniref:hypothetical protein n=1 Tax=Parasphingorhabdus sp. TaxID=2709688 RepID=UPI003297A98D
QSTGTLKFPGLGPPPTCPFIYYYNVKEPVQNADNDFSRYCYRGEPLLLNFDDQQSGARVSRVVPVKRSLGGSPDSVNTLFHFCFKKIRILGLRRFSEQFRGPFGRVY